MVGPENSKEYKIIMTDRKNVLVEGVENVECFDDGEIILETKMGVLVLKGQNLHVVKLNLDDGIFIAEGHCKTLDFSDEKKGIKGKGKGFIQRILR